MAVCLQWERQHFGDFMLATSLLFHLGKAHKLYIKNEEDDSKFHHEIKYYLSYDG